MSRVRPLILIVEDEPRLRQLYVQQLTISGFDVIEAGNGLEAMERASTQLPDVVLMDLSIPVMDGWEATRRLKAAPATMHIPVVALTAHDDVTGLEAAKSAGCDWFVPKPCQPQDLMAEVRRVLATSGTVSAP